MSASFDDPVSCVTAHTAGTAAVLEACRDAKVQRIVYISSAEVRQRDVKSGAEDAPLVPLSPHGAAKIAAEELVRSAARCMALISAILHCFPHGPGQNDRSVLSSIIRQARTSGTIRLFDLTPPRLARCRQQRRSGRPLPMLDDSVPVARSMSVRAWEPPWPISLRPYCLPCPWRLQLSKLLLRTGLGTAR